MKREASSRALLNEIMSAGLDQRLLTHPRLLLLVIGAVSLLAALWDFSPLMERWGDNAEFIVLARSIVQGKWMQLINQPDSPRSDKFPFGFPLLLAGVETVAPGNMLAMKGLILTLYVVAMPLLYLLLQRYLPPLPAVAATLLSLLNPLLLPFSHQVMSEIPYLLTSILALLCFERSAQMPGRRGTQWLMGGALLCVAATTLRIVGVSLFGGAVLWCLIRRQYRQGLWLMGVYLGVLLGLHLLGAGVFGSFYVGEAMKLDPNQPELGRSGLAELPGRVLGNLASYGLTFIPRAISPIPKILQAGVSRTWFEIPLPFGILTGGLICVGFAKGLLERRASEFYLLSYSGILLLWPSTLPQPRYLSPIIPFLLLCFFDGLSTGIRFIARRSRQLQLYVAPLHVTACLTVAGILLILNLLTLYEVRAVQRDYPPHWKSYFEAAEWLRDHSPPDAVVVARKPFLAHLIAERKTFMYLFSPDPEVVIKDIRRQHATFVIADSLELFGTKRYLIPAINARREQFELAYSTPTVPTTYVFRVRE